MNAKKKYLVDNYGLAADATDEQVQAAYDALSAEEKAEVDAGVASLSEEKPAEEKPAVTLARRQKVITDAGDEMLALEGKRVAQLQQLGTTLKVSQEAVSLSIARGDSVLDARKAFLAELQATCKPLNSVKVGENLKVAAMSAALPDAIMLRSGRESLYAFDTRGRVKKDINSGQAVKREAHEMAAALASRDVLGMFASWMVAFGAPAEEVYGMSRAALSELLKPRQLARKFPQVATLAQSTSDFPSVLENVLNKQVRQYYFDQPATWNIWARRGTLTDFKPGSRVVISEVPSLTARNEGGEIKYVALSDGKETIQLQEYTNGIKLTRQMLINDDLDVFSRLPQLQAAAAKRLEDDLSYGVLTGNPNMADGGALFNTTATTTAGGHKNLVASGGTFPTIASTQATELLMMKQTGPKGAARLELDPKFMLVPSSLKASAIQFNDSQFDPTKNNNTPNPYAKRFTVIPSARLDDNSTTAWYLLADYRDGQVDTVEVAFLADEPEPVTKAETEFDTDDVKYAIRHTVTAKALDFRGMAKNPGA